MDAIAKIGDQIRRSGEEATASVFQLFDLSDQRAPGLHQGLHEANGKGQNDIYPEAKVQLD